MISPEITIFQKINPELFEGSFIDQADLPSLNFTVDSLPINETYFNIDDMWEENKMEEQELKLDESEWHDINHTEISEIDTQS